ncbi:VirB8/TrbF family protein [Marinivivus vitaminiproducens]|uniref:VirB8/TrbF family protein n=1 Tax=Marinivivus vitaminiproducens TaxID=3035935 RepID=UPI00279C2706|nr:VirB8/TrbF family protein [Geminicoccaceae bacterium SCSIO 64248]
MVKTDGETSLNLQEQLWRDMGFGRTKLRLVYGTLFVITVANLALGVQVYLARQAPQAQSFIVVTDGSGRVAQIQRANQVWQPEDGVWINQAIDWLRNVRARPSDPDTFRWQAERIRATTARDLWAPLNEWMAATAEDLRERSVDFELSEATLVQADENGAAVFLRWRERKRMAGSTGAWTTFAATATLAKVAPTTTKEIADNPLGIYVTDYSFTSEAN